MFFSSNLQINKSFWFRSIFLAFAKWRCRHFKDRSDIRQINSCVEHWNISQVEEEVISFMILKTAQYRIQILRRNLQIPEIESIICCPHFAICLWSLTGPVVGHHAEEVCQNIFQKFASAENFCSRDFFRLQSCIAQRYRRWAFCSESYCRPRHAPSPLWKHRNLRCPRLRRICRSR